MSLFDMFSAEDRVTMPISSLVALIRSEEEATAAAEITKRAVQYKVPYKYIQQMLNIEDVEDANNE